jgi:hypothetical protein
MKEMASWRSSRARRQQAHINGNTAFCRKYSMKSEEYSTLPTSMFTILVFLAVLSVLVVAHELGHFWAARRAGVTVEEFGLGFPPKLFSWKDKKGTEWTVNLIPLGGFVRMQG